MMKVTILKQRLRFISLRMFRKDIPTVLLEACLYKKFKKNQNVFFFTFGDRPGSTRSPALALPARAVQAQPQYSHSLLHLRQLRPQLQQLPW